MVLWRFGVYFPKQCLVDVQSHISALHKPTRCDFMRPEDAVERAPVLPCFVDYIKLNMAEESGSPQYKNL